LEVYGENPLSGSRASAELEAVFHGVRRVHTLGAFYNAPLTEDSGAGAAEDGGLVCPECGAALIKSGALCLVTVLTTLGCRDLETFRQEMRKARAFGGARASPTSS